MGGSARGDSQQTLETGAATLSLGAELPAPACHLHSPGTEAEVTTGGEGASPKSEGTQASDPGGVGGGEGGRRAGAGDPTPGDWDSELPAPPPPPPKARAAPARRPRGTGPGSGGGAARGAEESLPPPGRAGGRGGPRRPRDRSGLGNSAPSPVPQAHEGSKNKVCVERGREGIRARRLPASRPARTPTLRVGPLARGVGSGGRARVGYVSSCGCACVSESSGLRGTMKECPPPLFSGARRAWHGGCTPGAGPKARASPVIPLGPGSSPGTQGGHSLGEKEGKSLLQVQTLGSRGAGRAPPPAADPTQGPTPAPLFRRHPDSRHRKLPPAAWAY